MRSLLILSIIFLSSVSAYSETFMEEYENREGVYIYKKTLEVRSNYSSSIKRFSSDGKVSYRFTEHGEGDYDKYEDVIWDSVAEMEEKEGFLQTVYSSRIIRDRSDNTIIKYRKDFDYDNKKIHCIALDGEDNIIRKKSFPIKGKTADDITMVYFLKTFVAHRDDKAYRNFYLISDEPSLYRITIKVMGPDILELPLGNTEAVRLRLIPNMGLLTGLSSAFIPSTFVWYIDNPPYIWLQYDGLETGLGSSHIVSYIISY